MKARNRLKLHRVQKWLWLCFGLVGLIDYAIRKDNSIANSIPVLFAVSVAANIIGEWAAEEATPGGDE
jgi:membrane-associated PAP2 superfamily phosphatase